MTCFQPPFCVQNIRKSCIFLLKDHKDRHNLHEPFQSAYRKHHSTETALLRVQNDILHSVDNGYCVFLVLLDLSAAFDTVSHAVLLHRLQQRNGISNSAHQWIVSYLNGLSQRVQISGTMSCEQSMECGVPQGSVLGPDFFTDYSAPTAELIRSHNIIPHCYADDTQLYISFKPGENETQALHQLEVCIADLRSWMVTNKLKLNDGKTEFIVFGSRHALKKVQTSSIKIGNHEIAASANVRNIGALFDKEMKMERQVANMCKTAYYKLFTVGKIRKFLTKDRT